MSESWRDPVGALAFYSRPGEELPFDDIPPPVTSPDFRSRSPPQDRHRSFALPPAVPLQFGQGSTSPRSLQTLPPVEEKVLESEQSQSMVSKGLNWLGSAVNYVFGGNADSSENQTEPKFGTLQEYPAIAAPAADVFYPSQMPFDASSSFREPAAYSPYGSFDQNPIQTHFAGNGLLAEPAYDLYSQDGFSSLLQQGRGHSPGPQFHSRFEDVPQTPQFSPVRRSSSRNVSFNDSFDTSEFFPSSKPSFPHSSPPSRTETRSFQDFGSSPSRNSRRSRSSPKSKPSVTIDDLQSDFAITIDGVEIENLRDDQILSYFAEVDPLVLRKETSAIFLRQQLIRRALSHLEARIFRPQSVSSSFKHSPQRSSGLKRSASSISNGSLESFKPSRRKISIRVD